MKKISIALLVLVAACSSNSNKYDPATYYKDQERADLLSGIVNYIFIAPPYTAMKDRFKPEHKEFYNFHSQKFTLDQLYVDNHKRHFYLVLRPGPTVDQKRATGGYFDVADDKQFENFREAFVTPLLPDSVASAKGRFLFDQMVKGDLARHLKMSSYVQWPNQASYYDSTIYEWRMDVNENDTTVIKADTVKIN